MPQVLCRNIVSYVIALAFKSVEIPFEWKRGNLPTIGLSFIQLISSNGSWIRPEFDY